VGISPERTAEVAGMICGFFGVVVLVATVLIYALWNRRPPDKPTG